MINELSIWIEVADIRKHFPSISPNTSTESIDPYILLSETLDLASLIDENLVNDIDDMILSPSLIRPELNDFFNIVVKPFISACSFHRYFPYAGINTTQWTVEEYGQEGFKPISDKRRGEMTNIIEGLKNTFQVKLLKYLQDAKYTLDGVVYKGKNCAQTKPKLSFSVIGAGNVNRNDNYNYNRHERLY